MRCAPSIKTIIIIRRRRRRRNNKKWSEMTFDYVKFLWFLQSNLCASRKEIKEEEK